MLMMHRLRSLHAKYFTIAALLAMVLASLPSCATANDEQATSGRLTLPTRLAASAEKETISESSAVPAPQEPQAIAPISESTVSSNSSSSDPLSGFGPSSGTVVGNRALELRDEVLRLRSSVNLNSNQFSVLRSSGAAGAVQYHSTVAAITARLQNGTTHSNPILLRQWEEANSSLDEVTTSLNRLNSLLTSVDADASVASYLQQSIQAAFELAGAVDEDHDQLKLLRDEVSRQVVQLDYIRTQTSADIQRQSSYLTAERSNMQALAFAISRGELLGNSLSNRPVFVNPTPMALPTSSDNGFGVRAAPTTAVTPANASSRDYSNAGASSPLGRLLVLIRFNEPNVEYAQQLSQAVGKMLESNPQSEFSVVAVSPSSGTTSELAKGQESAKRNAEEVKRALVQMGLSPNRIALANTQTQTTQVPEVHVYVR